MGLLSTLVIPQLKDPIPTGTALQIIHTKSNHWVVDSTIGCPSGEIRLFDSFYNSIYSSTKSLVSTAFGQAVSVTLQVSQKQQGWSDFGVFAIATCVVLAYGLAPKFDKKIYKLPDKLFGTSWTFSFSQLIDCTIIIGATAIYDHH